MSIDPKELWEAVVAVLDGKPVKPKDQPEEVRRMVDVFREIEKRASTETLDELESIGHAFEQYAWKAGWATVRLYEECLANGGKLTVEDCCWYVCVASFNGMRSMNTVKRYYHNASFFSPKTVSKHPDLSFSTFEYARSREKGKTWRDVLALAEQQKVINGRPPSVAWLREKLDGKVKVKKTPVIKYDLTMNYEGATSFGAFANGNYMQTEPDPIPPSLSASSDGFLDMLSDTLTQVSMLIPVIAEQYPQLSIATTRIVSILKQIVNAAKTGVDAKIDVP